MGIYRLKCYVSPQGFIDPWIPHDFHKVRRWWFRSPARKTTCYLWKACEKWGYSPYELMINNTSTVENARELKHIGFAGPIWCEETHSKTQFNWGIILACFNSIIRWNRSWMLGMQTVFPLVWTRGGCEAAPIKGRNGTWLWWLWWQEWRLGWGWLVGWLVG